jgi:hypothetical protein
MHVELVTDAARERLPVVLHAMAARADVQAVLLLACDADGHTPASADAALAACPKPVLGGVFPRIVYGTDCLERGLLVVGLRRPVDIAVVDRLSRREAGGIGDVLEANGSCSRPGETVMAFADGLSAGIAALIEALFDVHGLGVHYIGGGAGSLRLVPGPCVFTNRGLLADAAVVGRLRAGAGLGVRHGWQPVSEAFRVTAASGNVIESLDWRPAYSVWHEVLTARQAAPDAGADFFETAKRFPFGIERVGGEIVVRDPIARDGDRLVCVGPVPQGAFVRVLHGRPETLVAAAADARRAAWAALPAQAQPYCTLFIDCISRVLFLGEAFGRELHEVGSDAIPTIGALTLGEIANSGRSFLEFHNKTAVVALLLP